MNKDLKEKKLNETEEPLDFESWDKKELINYIKKHVNIKPTVANKNTNKSSKGKNKKEFDFTKCCYRYIALKIAYFGWNYQGFAAQAEESNVSSIEGHLFDALKKLKLIQNRKSCHYSLCGRTDKGVSAFSQIVGLYVRSSLKSDPSKGIYTFEELKNLKKKNIPIGGDSMEIVNDNDNENENDNNSKPISEPFSETFIKATEQEMDYVNILNRILPPDIRILAWSPIKPSFNARYDCSYRKYHYFFSSQDLDIELMQKACKKFEGHHDFRNFCKIDPTKKNKFQRTIYSCSIFKAKNTSEITKLPKHQDISSSTTTTTKHDNHPFDIYVFEIKGMAFLWHQVRCCMAVLFLIGKHKEDIEIIDQLFNVNDEKDIGKPVYDLAPEIPLVLVDTGYPKNTFYWINDKNTTSNNNPQNCINYIKNMSVLLEIWQYEAIKLSLISKLLIDQWIFQTHLNSDHDDDVNPAYHQNFNSILKYIQSYNLDGWYNSKRIQKITVKNDNTLTNTTNYTPLLKRKKCDTFTERLEKKKQKK